MAVIHCELLNNGLLSILNLFKGCVGPEAK